MQTHEDNDARRDWLRSLTEKADRMQSRKQSEITTGKEGEASLAEFTARRARNLAYFNRRWGNPTAVELLRVPWWAFSLRRPFTQSTSGP